MMCCFTSGFKRRNHFVDIAWKGVPCEVIQNNRIVTAAAVGGEQPLQNVAYMTNRRRWLYVEQSHLSTRRNCTIELVKKN